MDMTPQSGPAEEIPMEEIVQYLLGRLSDKGLIPEEIPRLIEDVLNMVADGGYFTIEDINQRLQTLGWEEPIMDSVTFELILSLVERKGEYEIRRYKLH
jgi:hypothetical protein